MKRIVILLASVALVAGGLQILPATAAEPAPGEVKFYLGSTGCSADDVNFDFLTTTDADHEIECNYTSAGLRYEVGAQTGTVGETSTPIGTQRPLSSREDATRYFDSIDGGPVTLDASRPATGTIFTSGPTCPVGGAPACSPVGASAGEVVIEIALVGKNGETAVELGTQTDTFQTAPGDPHATELNIQPDAALTGQTFEVIELQTWVHGPSAGQGIIKTNGDYSSFISIPTTSAKPVKTAKPKKPKKPAKTAKPKKPKKPKAPKSKGCAAFTPGDMGKDAPTVVLTDAATEAAPVEQTVSLDMSAANWLPEDPATSYFNVQVDSEAENAGLYALLEFPERRDYDMILFYPDGQSFGAESTAGNTTIEDNTPEDVGHGGEAGAGYEKLVGVKSTDCQGWTMETSNWFGEGGDFTVKLWLGEATTDPLAPGEGTP